MNQTREFLVCDGSTGRKELIGMFKVTDLIDLIARVADTGKALPAHCLYCDVTDLPYSLEFTGRIRNKGPFIQHTHFCDVLSDFIGGESAKWLKPNELMHKIDD